MFGIRNLMLTVLAALMMLSPTANLSAGNPPTASAASRAKVTIYWVYYRVNAHHAWTCYGGYYQRQQAILACAYFRYFGYDAYYR